MSWAPCSGHKTASRLTAKPLGRIRLWPLPLPPPRLPTLTGAKPPRYTSNIAYFEEALNLYRVEQRETGSDVSRRPETVYTDDRPEQSVGRSCSHTT
ncbi:hypothetical protein J6590_007685 [Homalodisca vitripennis]|nr:hypothetical protein J6590_007685 [Homalodisca vitripennis]